MTKTANKYNSKRRLRFTDMRKNELLYLFDVNCLTCSPNNKNSIGLIHKILLLKHNSSLKSLLLKPHIHYMAQSIQTPFQITEIRCSHPFHNHKCMKLQRLWFNRTTRSSWSCMSGCFGQILSDFWVRFATDTCPRSCIEIYLRRTIHHLRQNCQCVLRYKSQHFWSQECSSLLIYFLFDGPLLLRPESAPTPLQSICITP